MNENKKTIFLIEDDFLLVRAYEAKFKKEKINAWIANDGKQALEYLSKEPPAVILLDLMLPGLSGFEVLSAIRKNSKWKNVPVLILTNLGQAQDVEKAKQIGRIDDYIIKANVKISEVIDKVKTYL